MVLTSPCRLRTLLLQTLREAARSSQAEFLSTVLPSGGDTASSSPPITPRPEHWSSVAEAVPKPQRGVDGGTAGTGADHGSSSSAADDNAVARWASLQRLRDQSVGLGGAAQHQLGRALELCRGLRGLKVKAAKSVGHIDHASNSDSDTRLLPNVVQSCCKPPEPMDAPDPKRNSRHLICRHQWPFASCISPPAPPV